MKEIAVLGAGLVGHAIVKDLADTYKITAVDSNRDRLDKLPDNPHTHTIQKDLTAPGVIERVVTAADLVISALPGFMGMEALSRVIHTGTDVVDIAFSPEDPLTLNETARAHGVTAVVDCGVAPGLSNLVLGYEKTRMQEIHRFECLVGGLPLTREWPCEYKAVFSPIDVIEEYTRPARYIENGHEVVRPALSDPEYVSFPHLGTLEACNTDGLRTLARTMDIPNMKEKTLRYPGHFQLMKALREIGFFDKTPITIQGISISPLDITARILFPKWELRADEADFTCMRLTIEGVRAGKPTMVIYELLDRFDPETGITSMARTTGYTCTAVARLLLENGFKRDGICPPEYLGENPGTFEQVIRYLDERNIRLLRREEADTEE